MKRLYCLLFVWFAAALFLTAQENAMGRFRELRAGMDAKSAAEIALAPDAMLVIRLEVNPSSGYQWEVVNPSQAFAVFEEKKGSGFGPQFPEYETPEHYMPGAPLIQVLRFVGKSAGKADIRLALRRPWTAGYDKESLVTYRVQSQGRFNGTFNPPKPPVQKYRPLSTAEVAAPGLPAHFDWREQNGVTAVRDQGQCGSCWAHGTCAVFESKLKIKKGLDLDLSEQYLVSCNVDGYGCGGGWWGHDYHWYKCIPSESGAGARYESDFPYTATQAPCNAPHTPHEQLEGWGYCDDVADNATPSLDHNPTVAQIKEKIYNYGPVGTDVCSSTWGSYTGGVFTSNCTTPTHIVAITGWDDTEGCFYIKNSWGTSWGEAGYMKLAYNTCLVGHNSTYVLYEKSNPRIIYRSMIFNEGKANDGSILTTIEARIEDSTTSTRFSVTSGYLTAGTHFTTANVPAGLSVQVQAVDATHVRLSLSGKASAHANANDIGNLTVNFANAAFTGNNAAAVENASCNQLKVNFNDPYQLIYYDPADVTINSANVWQFYWLEGSDYSYSFGVWYYDGVNETDPNNKNCMKFESYTHPILSYGTALPPNVKPLNYGDEIGPNSTIWAAGGTYGEQHTLSGPGFSEWYGRTCYLGFTFDFQGFPVYGWMKIQIGSDGRSATLLDYAWNQDPNKSIRAGYTTDSSGTAPTADFSADKVSVKKGEYVQFTDTSSGAPTSWQWTFSGGTPSSSTSRNPLVQYNTVGTFDVTLRADNSYGSNTKTRTAYISVTDATPSVTVTTPNGGESWTRGSTYAIKWTSANVTNVKIELLKGTAVNSTIASSVAASGGTYNWAIPSSQATGTDYKVRITCIDSGKTASDSSNANFSITATATPSITVTTPNGGESWTRGSTYAIKWTSANVTNVKIELLKGTAVNSVIASSVAASAGTFNWAIPAGQATGTNYKIRITCIDSGKTASDSSNANFSITSSGTVTVRVVSPNGGEYLPRGYDYTLKWSAPNSRQVDVALYKGGSFVMWCVWAQPAANGQAVWTVPTNLYEGSDYTVRVYDYDTRTITDDSDANFTIY